MRILFLIRSLGLGGAERQLIYTATGLAEKGHEVTILTLYPGGPLEKEIPQSSVSLESLQKRGRWDLFGPLINLGSRLHRVRPDVVYTYMDVPNVLSGLLRPFGRNTALVWGIRASDMDLSRYDALARVMFHAERLASRIPDRIIVNSQAGLRYRLAHGFPDDPATVVPNGIDTERFSRDVRQREAFRTELGVAEDIQLIGHIGRVDPMKDHQTLLGALSRIDAGGRDVHTVLVGDGSDDLKRDLEARSSSLGLSDAITWLGHRTDMPAVHNGLDLLVLSSAWGEGFPNVLGEAMATGTPCVATDVGDAALILQGIWPVVPPEDPPALADAIERILGMEPGEREKRTEAARDRIEDRYSVDTLVDRTEAILMDAIEARRDR